MTVIPELDRNTLRSLGTQILEEDCHYISIVSIPYVIRKPIAANKSTNWYSYDVFLHRL